MSYIIDRIYVGETGGWYAQVSEDGRRIELAFDHLPLGAEIEAALIEQPVMLPDIELEAEDGEII